MRKCTLNDKQLVVSILSEAFENDPHMNYLFAKNKFSKYTQLLIDFSFDETIRKGEVYINDSNSAVIMWNTEQKEPFSWNIVYRYLTLIFNISPFTTIQLLKVGAKTQQLLYNHKHYVYLYFIGTLNSHRGIGEGSKLMDFALNKIIKMNKPIFLETTNAANIPMYEKKGFEIIETIPKGNIMLYAMMYKRKS